MNPKNKKVSKFLSLVLRHKPEIIDLTLDQNGWAEVKELLEKSNKNGSDFTFEELEEVVVTNDKQRFTFNEDKTRIRANQGHSIKVNLDYEPTPPPAVLYHGTATRYIDAILKEGLIKGKRHHVHLSKDVETASKVGVRHGKLILLEIDAQAMQQDGFEFFVSKNGVWLTDSVPAKYLKYFSKT